MNSFVLRIAVLAVFAGAIAYSAGAQDGQTVETPSNSVASPTEQSIQAKVSPPVLIKSVRPRYSVEAEKAQFSGTVAIKTLIDTEGRPTQVQVVRGVGMGLDENAIAAVQKYRFKPAMQNGHPVAVYLGIAVDFRVDR